MNLGRNDKRELVRDGWSIVGDPDPIDSGEWRETMALQPITAQDMPDGCVPYQEAISH